MWRSVICVVGLGFILVVINVVMCRMCMIMFVLKVFIFVCIICNCFLDINVFGS